MFSIVDNLKLCKNEQNVALNMRCGCLQFESDCWWNWKMSSASAGVCVCVCGWVRWEVFDVYALCGMQLTIIIIIIIIMGVATALLIYVILDDAHAFTLALSPRSCGTTDGGAWLIHSFLRPRSLDARLIHQISNALLQIIDPIAHVIDTCDYLIRHGLELILHVLQKILYLIRKRRGGREIGGWGVVVFACCFCCCIVFLVVAKSEKLT